MADGILEIQRRFEQSYPKQAEMLKNASEEEVFLLQNRFVKEAKDKLTRELEKADIKQDIKEMLQSTDETVAVGITEQLYEVLCGAQGDEIQTEVIKFFDTIERLKDMGTQDAEMMTYAMVNGGLAALGIAMLTDLIVNLLAGLGLAEAIFTVIVTLGTTVIGMVVDIVVLCIIPIFYFMAKPAACVFLIMNELESDLVIAEEKVIHGKVNVKTKTISAVFKLKHTIRSGGIWSTQKKDGALIGSKYAVVFEQKKSSFGPEPDSTKFAVGVECPLASRKNSCAVGINKTASEIGNEVDDHRKQYASDENGAYKMEMRCNSGSGSVAYYICRIYKK